MVFWFSTYLKQKFSEKIKSSMKSFNLIITCCDKPFIELPMTKKALATKM